MSDQTQPENKVHCRQRQHGTFHILLLLLLLEHFIVFGLRFRCFPVGMFFLIFCSAFAVVFPLLFISFSVSHCEMFWLQPLFHAISYSSRVYKQYFIDIHTLKCSARCFMVIKENTDNNQHRMYWIGVFIASHMIGVHTATKTTGIK